MVIRAHSNFAISRLVLMFNSHASNFEHIYLGKVLKSMLWWIYKQTLMGVWKNHRMTQNHTEWHRIFFDIIFNILWFLLKSTTEFSEFCSFYWWSTNHRMTQHSVVFTKNPPTTEWHRIFWHNFHYSVVFTIVRFISD